MHRDVMGQPSLAEVFVGESLGQNARLDRIDQAIEWERLGQLVGGIHAAREGPPLAIRRPLMAKVLLLEQWYSLSDPQMEEALRRPALRVRLLRGRWGRGRHARSLPRSAAFGRSWRRRG